METTRVASKDDAMEEMRSCPFCAHDDLEVIVVDETTHVLAVRCPECGTIGPRSGAANPANAAFAWNLRMGHDSSP
jgi:endogenous inhibitor of DNA gyrase (YacG/DUF329 family)